MGSWPVTIQVLLPFPSLEVCQRNKEVPASGGYIRIPSLLI